MERDQLLEKLTVLDFAALDLALYLDTHPEDQEAICCYNDILKKAEHTRCLYEKTAGPLCSYRSPSPLQPDHPARPDHSGHPGCSCHPMWQWDSELWPWNCQYNFYLDGRGGHHVGV